VAACVVCMNVSRTSPNASCEGAERQVFSGVMMVMMLLLLAHPVAYLYHV